MSVLYLMCVDTVLIILKFQCTSFFAWIFVDFLQVCFTGLSEENGSKTLQEMKIKNGEGNVLFCQCDVTDYKGMESEYWLIFFAFITISIPWVRQ